MEYIAKTTDELTKNHQNGKKELISGIMPARPDHKMCPVCSFKKYMEHLHPQNYFLWQTPNMHPSDEGNTRIWYTKGQVGKNTLATFMSRMSKKAGLSHIYTNHSIRVTGITILKRAGYTDKQVMAVSGHRSVQSLAIYQKVNTEEKQQMGSTMFNAMKEKSTNFPALPAPSPITPRKAIMEPPAKKFKENVMDALVPFFPDIDLLNKTDENTDDFDFDLAEILAQCEKETCLQAHQQQNVNVATNAPQSMFAGCKIGTVNIYIHKDK